MVFDSRRGDGIVPRRDFSEDHPFAVGRDLKIFADSDSCIAAKFFGRHFIGIVIINRHPFEWLDLIAIDPHRQLLKTLFDGLLPRANQMKTGNFTLRLLLDAVVHTASVYYCIFIHYKADSLCPANTRCLLCEQTRRSASLLL
ncbi:hypothetical protein D3C85_1437020 [compost metagenome]